MEVSYLFILQLRPLPCGPGPFTLFMTRTSWSVLILSFCSISWFSFMPQLHPSIRRCNSSPQAFGGAAIQALLLSWHSSSESPLDLLIVSGQRHNYSSNYVSVSDLIGISRHPLYGRSFVTCHYRCRATAGSWCYVWKSGQAASSWPLSSPLPSGLQQWVLVVVPDNPCLIPLPSRRPWFANCPSPRLFDNIGLLIGWKLLAKWYQVCKFGVSGEFMDLWNFGWKLCVASGYQSNFSWDRPRAHIITVYIDQIFQLIVQP